MNKLRKSLRACAHILLWVLIAWHLFWPILLGSARYSAPAVTSLYTALAGCVNWLGLYSLSLALGLLLGGWAMHIVTDVLGFNSKVAGHPIPKEKVDVKFARETQACVREVTPPTGPGWVKLESDGSLYEFHIGDFRVDVALEDTDLRITIGNDTVPATHATVPDGPYLIQHITRELAVRKIRPIPTNERTPTA